MDSNGFGAGAGVAPGGWRGVLRGGENWLVVLALGGLMVLPLLEVVLRPFRAGVPGSIVFVQHLTLFVGMLGAALAARDGRLLSLSTLSHFLSGHAKLWARLVSASMASAITVYLCVASIRFVVTEHEGGGVMAYGIPVWVVQLVLPIGFGLVALRLIWHASDGWAGRGWALVATGLLVGLAAQQGVDASRLMIPALGLLLVATALGAPVFTAIGGAALILLWGGEYPLASVPLKHYSLVTSQTLPAIPLFTLAGYFLAEGGASRRLVRVFQVLVGRVRGGPAIVTALVCAFFTSFTGASGVTILALGGLLMPVLISARYSERNALGLLTSAGSLGLLFPPCLPLIVYAFLASNIASNMGLETGVTIEKMFLAGILPGCLLVGLTAWWGIRVGPRKAVDRPPFDAREAWQAVREAKWELLMPVVALGALFSGYATAIEAAALTAGYAFVIETFVYRDLKLFRDVPRVMTECGLLVGGVLLILGVAMGLTHYLVMEQVPDRLVEWSGDSIHSRWMFLLLLNVFLLLVGCLMDVYSALAVVTPLIVPVGLQFGVDPVHLGIIFLANLELGYLTPPVGMNLFLSSYRFKKPVPEVIRSVIPLLLVLLVGVLLITYVPALTMTLPNLLLER
jgi:C4-dicarboxylate transporter, DctM subunit